VGSVADVKAEIFGPILHVVRYRGEYLDQVINDINALGYGLTLGLHTRLESTMEMVAARARVGNLYVNRNMIGAVVGVQPFGGEGMSGTGFKSGGPNYLLKFVTERVYTQNTTAAGGNASLVSSV
jgi:RHH-type proline utilization regulon transcriptional repressor/proline dehydrogenase/delta 1-pyrroline-5-carboxylate dehydrogenase